MRADFSGEQPFRLPLNLGRQAFFKLMRKKLIGTGGIVACLVSAAYIALCRYQPPLPDRWQQIYRGQPRSQVLALFPELNTELHDMKDFDQTVLVSQSLLFGHIWRNIHVRYNGPSGDSVESIWTITHTGRFNFLRNHKAINRGAPKKQEAQPVGEFVLLQQASRTH